MRTVVVVRDFPTGTETFIVRHIRGLEADVVAERMDPGALDGWSEVPETAVLRTERRRPPSIRARLLRRVRTALPGAWRGTWPRAMEDLFDEYVRRRRPDVVLAEYGPNGLKVLPGCRRHGLPLVVHFHGYDVSSLLRFRWYRDALPALVAYARAVVVVGRHMRERLEDLGCAREKIHVIPCGAPLEMFTPSERVADQPCRFFAASALHLGKGPLLTLRAFERCLAHVGDVTLTVSGGGNLLARARRWVRRRGLEGRIELRGHQTIEVVRDEMARSGCFLQHSVRTRLGWDEGWGVSMAEAAATALPVIATRSGGIPDHVIDGETGYLVEPGDWQAMSERMAEVAADPPLRRRLGEAGRRNIEAVGDATRQLEALRAVLQHP